MRIIHYSDLLKLLCPLARKRWDVLQLEAFDDLRAFVQLRLEHAWNVVESPIWKRLETRTPDENGLIPWAQTGALEIGEVMGVWAEHPGQHPGTRQMRRMLTESGITILDRLPESGTVWVEYRLVEPRLEGDRYESGETYAAGAQVWHEDADGVVDFWQATATTTAEPGGTGWARVEIPRELELYLVLGAYAFWLDADGQAEKAMAQEAKAQEALMQAADKWGRRQGVGLQIEVAGY